MIAAALDTSCGASLALARDERVVFTAALPGRQREADRDLVPWVQAGLAQAGMAVTEIGRWTVGSGPGSFSGIRTGIALVRGVCAVTGAACRGVPSSMALALALAERGGVGERIGVLHDARCGQVILSRYRWAAGSVFALGPASAETPADLAGAALLCDSYITVHGAEVLPLLPEPIRRATRVVNTLEARHLLRASPSEWPSEPAAVEASLDPVYVRPPVFVPPRPVAALDSP